MNPPDTETRGFSFPGTFEVTAFAYAEATFETQIAAVLAEAGVTALTASLRTRPSSKGNFNAVSISFLCPDRAHYDRVHEVLKAHPAVKWTL